MIIQAIIRPVQTSKTLWKNRTKVYLQTWDVKISFPLQKHHKNMLKYGVKLDEKIIVCQKQEYFWCVFVHASLHMRREENQLDVTVCTLWYSQYVSGTSIPIVRSSRLYVCICRLWCAVRTVIQVPCCLFSLVICTSSGIFSDFVPITVGFSFTFSNAHNVRIWKHVNENPTMMGTKSENMPLEVHTTNENKQKGTWMTVCTAHHRRQIHTYSLEILMMGIEVPETCWAYHKVHTVTSSWFFFSKNIFNKNFFNKEGGQFRIFLLMHKAHCSLCFNSIRIDNVREGDRQRSRGFSVCSHALCTD